MTTIEAVKELEEVRDFLINKCAELEARLDYYSELMLRIGDSFDRRMDALESMPVEVVLKRG